ncbi:putative methyltransferase type 11, S-adenosyl-L-methionine-dependent methyltransferase [Septoria linicola]|nr:putative methyltransferase type 11, S-adenosyl-L-methionine-dependent methyltransferase [Septoria linicola]
MTSTTQPGQNQYVPGYKKQHIQNHAWRTAENSCAYLIPTLHAKVKAHPQLHALDVGAGPGTITASLAKYFPDGHIIATDLSPDVVAQAQANAAPNMSAQTASIYDLPFEKDSFDFVHAHQVLCHLDQPLTALKEMLRVCKTGGFVAVREADVRMSNVWPEREGLVETYKALMAVMKAAGGSDDLGARLVNLAMQAGVERGDIQASMGTWCYSTPEERQMFGNTFATRLREGNMRSVILDKKLGWTAEQLDSMADDWDKWIETEDGCTGFMHGEVIITKR